MGDTITFTYVPMRNMFFIISSAAYLESVILNKIENDVSIVKIFNMLNLLSQSSKDDEESISIRKEDIIRESDDQFVRYVIDHFNSGKGNSILSKYVYRYDADSTCYQKLKEMMEEDPIDYSIIDNY